MAQSLRQEHCKDISEKRTKLWKEWILKYKSLLSLSPQIKIKNPKYVVLNFIAKQIIE